MFVTILRADPPTSMTLDRGQSTDETLAGLLGRAGVVGPGIIAEEMLRRDVALVLVEESPAHLRVTAWTGAGERAVSGGAPSEPHLMTALLQLRVRRGRPRKVEPSEVRALAAQGLTHAAIAERLGVSRTTVTMAMKEKS